MPQTLPVTSFSTPLVPGLEQSETHPELPLPLGRAIAKSADPWQAHPYARAILTARHVDGAATTFV